MTTDRAMELAPADLAYYQAILRAFPEQGRAPDAAWLAAEAAARGLDVGAVLDRLEEHDLIVRDRTTGAIVSMYPFSGVPTPHRVLIAGAQPVYSMCAVDALGIPFMLDRDAVIESVDPTDGTPIRVAVRHGSATWQPETAAVLTAALEDVVGPKAASCCPIMHFFATAEAAEAYRLAHPHAKGRMLNQAEAVAHGIRYFGSLLNLEGPGCACDDDCCTTETA
jgi:hypothetical protein